jgi:hypothetical protein
MDIQSLIIFVIASFSFAGVIVLKKEAVAPQLRRPLAIIAIFLVSCSFFLILFGLLFRT